MKILIAGDWHGYTDWAIKVVELASRNNIQTIFQLGDFGWWPGQGGIKYKNALSQCLIDSYVKLYWLPGNHEWYDDIDEFPNRFNASPKGFYEVAPNMFYMGKVNTWTWRNKKFAVVGGAVSIDREFRRIHESWWPQEQLTDEEVEKAKCLGKIDYLFTHDCPQAHPFQHLVPDVESEIHRRKMTGIARKLDPMLWFHGHMHIPAKYPFDGRCTVYSLDCDDSTMRDHVKILDVDSGEVTDIKE